MAWVALLESAAMGWQDRRLVEADERRLLPSRLASRRRRYWRAAALQHTTFLVMSQTGVFHIDEGGSSPVGLHPGPIATGLEHITSLLNRPALPHFNTMRGSSSPNGFCLSAIGNHCSRSELLRNTC